MKRHSNFHASANIVFGLVLQLEVLHEIIVTIEVLQDMVKIVQYNGIGGIWPKLIEV